MLSCPIDTILHAAISIAARFVSVLLVYKLWRLDSYIHSTVSRRRARNTRRYSLLPVIYAVIDAAVLYSVALITTMICFILLTNVLAIMLSVVS